MKVGGGNWRELWICRAPKLGLAPECPVWYDSKMNKKYAVPDPKKLLRAAGLRSTAQRQALAALLFDGEHKHVTAEQVHAMARKRRLPVSLATVYNALRQFTETGLLREVVIDSARVYFDTNTGNHHHFYDSQSGHLMDIPASAVAISRLPHPPAGRKLDRVDVIVRIASA
jgi:Fur family transcriptional regulator, iron response regulator